MGDCARGGRRRGLLFAFAVTAACVPTIVFAQDNGATPPLPAQNGVPQSGAASPAAPVATPPEGAAPAPGGKKPSRNPADFKRFDDLREPMLTTRFPGLIDTITGDAGGWRSWLADRDIGVEVQIATNALTPFRGSGAPRNPQVYNGQRPTLQTNALNAYVTAGLAGLGLPNTKIIVAGGYLITSFDPNGPNTANFKELSVYQSFADKKIEIKAGFTENYVEYVGLFAGGNVTLTSGLGTLIPIQVGLSAEPGPTPTVNVQLNGKKGLYAKFGVQRSTNPLGNEEEVRRQGIGLDWHQHGAKALYIGEVGIRRESSPDQRSLWIRGGYIQNTSHYQRFLGGTDTNYAAYILADYQLTRPDSQMFFRGLYVGASAEVAPKNVNVYAKSGEARAYYVGPLAARPTDALTFTLTWNRYSSDFHEAYLPLGLKTEHYQVAGAVGYALHASAGITIAPALQYIVHPTPLPGYRNAVLGAMNVFLAL